MPRPLRAQGGACRAPFLNWAIPAHAQMLPVLPLALPVPLRVPLPVLPAPLCLQHSTAPALPSALGAPSTVPVLPVQLQCSPNPRNHHTPVLQTPPVPSECSQSLHQLDPSAPSISTRHRGQAWMKLPLLRKTVCYKHVVELILQKTGRLVKSSNYAKKWWVTHLVGTASGIHRSLAQRDPWHRGSLAQPGVAPHTQGLKVLYKSSY